MISLHKSCDNVTNENSGNYVFFTHGTKVYAEKKGVWTWIKANLLPTRWFGDYRLSHVVKAIRNVDACRPQILEVLQRKVVAYNSTRPSERHIEPVLVLGPEEQRTVASFQRHVDRISPEKPKESMMCRPAIVEFRHPPRSAEEVRKHSANGMPLIPLRNRNVNRAYAVCAPPAGIDHIASGTVFFSYGAEGIDDFGWGCAWRVIQTCISRIQKPSEPMISLLELYDRYGEESVLVDIYSRFHSHKKELSRVDGHPFAPKDVSDGYAEPFIAQMVLYDMGVDADLQVVNGIPAANSPHTVFPEEHLSFDVFSGRLKSHFSQASALPVMIDDGVYTFAIIGYGESADGIVRMWIADPHVAPGVNRGDAPVAGLYTIEYDAHGKVVSPDIPRTIQKKMSGHGASYDALRKGFSSQAWMVLFPGEAQR
jgi:hypothetical protein